MVSVNDFLSYSTVRQVKIQDPKLGVLNCIGMLFIVFYMVFYVVFHNQGFRKAEPVVGSASLSVDREHLLAFDRDMLLDFCEKNKENAANFLNTFWPAGQGGWTPDGKRRLKKSAAPKPAASPAPAKSASNGPLGRPHSASNGPKPPPSRGDEASTLNWTMMELNDKWYKLPCFFVPADMVTTSVPPNGIFVATRRNISIAEWGTAPCAPFDPDCTPSVNLRSSMLLPFSSFQLFSLDHLVHSGNFRFDDATGGEMQGYLVLKTGERIRIQDRDIRFTIGDMLHYAGETAHLDNATGRYQPTIEQRSNGGILLITLSYRNGEDCHTWWWCLPFEDELSYLVSLTVLKNGYELAQPTQPVSPAIAGTTWSREYQLQLDNGWLIVILQDFNIGFFDFGTFFLNLCAALGLLGLIRTGIDFLAKYVLANKEHYNKLLVLSSTAHGTWKKSKRAVSNEFGDKPSLVDGHQVTDRSLESLHSPSGRHVIDSE
eukprot:TRINITY_DN22745_c0_g1_i1.p1 TRINITY_DN22745_c0_g1~~TRINITY_DN22745_c0_g1_i1.p1  ORF type:complete len:487 (+),score=25.80 TRINITY_DN22745_c0_g1_i1:47-1507(+)